jgi:hypothetical protein
MIQVGRNRFRRDTWESMKDICAVEGTRLADEIWCAMDAHVKDYASKQSDAGDGSGLLDKGPRPDFSMPENANVFDKMVDDMVAEAAEEEVEEVVSEERRDRSRMAGSSMFGHYKKQS